MIQKIKNALFFMWKDFRSWRWYWQILFIIPVVVAVLFVFFFVIFTKEDHFKNVVSLFQKSEEKLKNSVKKNIFERESKISEIKEKIDLENIKQEEMEETISKIKEDMEEQINEIDSKDKPSPDDINKLFNSFRNRGN